MRPCGHSGCRSLVLPPTHYCSDHRQQHAPRKQARVREWKALEGHRGSARERGYTKAWERARASHLALHPLCSHCHPRPVAASVVDHIVPHGGNMSTFWIPENWQSLCSTHHFQKTRRENGLNPCTHPLRVKVSHLGIVCAMCGAEVGASQSLHVSQGTPAGLPSRTHGQVSSENQTGRVG